VTHITLSRAAPSTTTLHSRTPPSPCSSTWLAVVNDQPLPEASMSIEALAADPTIGRRRRCSKSVT